MIPRSDLNGLEEFCAHCDDLWCERCAEAGHENVVTDADFHFVVCPRCKGRGILRGWPGVYSQADFESPEDIDDYMHHQRTCEDCNGLRVIEVLHESAMTRPAVTQWLHDMWEANDIEAQERRMGA